MLFPNRFIFILSRRFSLSISSILLMNWLKHLQRVQPSLITWDERWQQTRCKWRPDLQSIISNQMSFKCCWNVEGKQSRKNHTESQKGFKNRKPYTRAWYVRAVCVLTAQWSFANAKSCQYLVSSTKRIRRTFHETISPATRIDIGRQRVVLKPEKLIISHRKRLGREICSYSGWMSVLQSSHKCILT